jgi:hypothetical protein
MPQGKYSNQVAKVVAMQSQIVSSPEALENMNTQVPLDQIHSRIRDIGFLAGR